MKLLGAKAASGNSAAGAGAGAAIFGVGSGDRRGLAPVEPDGLQYPSTSVVWTPPC